MFGLNPDIVRLFVQVCGPSIGCVIDMERKMSMMRGCDSDVQASKIPVSKGPAMSLLFYQKRIHQSGNKYGGFQS